MVLTDGESLYQCGGTGMLRSALHPQSVVPPAPVGEGGEAPGEQWLTWLGPVWANEDTRDAIEHASPQLAAQVRKLCGGIGADPRQVRRTAVSMLGYVQRMTGRATPFGLFAGVSPVTYGDEMVIAWGAEHRAVARADARWINDVIDQLESDPEVLRCLPLVLNNSAFVLGQRLVLPSPAQAQGAGRAAVEVSVRCTAPVRIVLDVARRPISGQVLVEKVLAEYPDVADARAAALVMSLVQRGFLVSALRAPIAAFDACGHLLTQIIKAGVEGVETVAPTVRRLRRICDLLAQHNGAAAWQRRCLRSDLRAEMKALSAVVEQPIAVDVRADCALILPKHVASEVERAATVLARLTPYPYGTPAWKDFHNRFFERYGVGSLVPLRDVTDPDVGLGYPTGFLNTEPEPPEAITGRDRRLLDLAQSAALEGRHEIELDERLIDELAVGDAERLRVPPHVELRFRIQAVSAAALARGEYRLVIVSPSRGAGTTTGRFLDLLDPEERAKAVALFGDLPVSERQALPVQVSFTPPYRMDEHVARAPEVLPEVISVGEHRPSDGQTIALDDLAVGCTPQRLYLMSLSRGCQVEPLTMNALNLRGRTPALVRFLVEISRASGAVVAPFSWGAAGQLPFLPRIRHGRTVLAPSRWRLRAGELPAGRAPWAQWRAGLLDWRSRRRVPAEVALVEGDRVLPLDLNEEAHLALLRQNLDQSDHAVLVESPTKGNAWFAGRAHELVAPLVARTPPVSTTPPISRRRLLTRDHGHLPAGSPWLMAKLYTSVDRHPQILGHHLPDLLVQWGSEPRWWYMRYRDPRWHLRLRIALTNADDFAVAAARVATWTQGLRALGLVSDLEFATSYPETGRWGRDAAMHAAEEVFAADSRALALAFTRPPDAHRQALIAASLASIAADFCGSAEAGMDWLIEHCRLSGPALDRNVRAQAIELANPDEQWAAARAALGSPATADAWIARTATLNRYRALLPTAEGVLPDNVLDSLLHVHHIRAAGIDKDDERTCLRLARAAAQAWKARRK